MIPRLRPGLVHLGAAKQREAFRVDEVGIPLLDQGALAAEVVAAGKRAVLDAETALEVGGDPLPLRRETLVAKRVAADRVEEQVDARTGTFLKQLHKQGEGLEAEVAPRRRCFCQRVVAVLGLAFVSGLVARAAGFDLNEGDAPLLFLGVSADVLGEFRNEPREKFPVGGRQVIGVTGPFSQMTLVVGEHLGDAVLVDPLRRLGTGAQGKIQVDFVLDRFLDRLIETAPVEDARLFFQFRPRRIEREPPQERILLGVEGITPIPNAEGTGRRFGPGAGGPAGGDQTHAQQAGRGVASDQVHRVKRSTRVSGTEDRRSSGWSGGT